MYQTICIKPARLVIQVDLLLRPSILSNNNTGHHDLFTRMHQHCSNWTVSISKLAEGSERDCTRSVIYNLSPSLVEKETKATELIQQSNIPNVFLAILHSSVTLMCNYCIQIHPVFFSVMLE
jgi:hypothetical protein